MISDQELALYIETLMRQAGPNAITAANAAVFVPAVVRQLESNLGIDLSHRTPFVHHHVHQLLLSAPNPPRFHPQPPRTLAAQHQLQHQQQLVFERNLSPFTHLPHQHELSFQCPAAGPGFAGQQQMQVLSQGSVTAVPTQKDSAPKRRGGQGGLSKVCSVSPELQAIVGEPTMARTQIVKQLWAYIRTNNLQDPNNKRKIICNDELRQVFETDCTDMFKMNKLLAKHIRPLDSTKDTGPGIKKIKEDTGPDIKKIKANPTEEVSTPDPNPDQYTVMISDALAKFFGTEEKEMLQSEASQRVWDYIKSNQLEDPLNTMAILCDSKLTELFGCESLSTLGVSQLLSRHMSTKS